MTCRHAHTRFQARKPLDPSHGAVLELVTGGIEHGLLRRRRPELHRVSDEGTEEAIRRYADDRVGYSIVIDGRADDAWSASEMILPQAVADYRDRVSAAPDVFVRQKATAEDWAHADRIEVIGGDELPNESFGAIASGKCGARDLADEECAERRRATREVHEVRPRHLIEGRGAL